MKTVIAEVGVSLEMGRELRDAEGNDVNLPEKRIEELRIEWRERMQSCARALQEYFGESVTLTPYKISISLLFPDDHPASDYDNETLREEIAAACPEIWHVYLDGDDADPFGNDEEY